MGVAKRVLLAPRIDLRQPGAAGPLGFGKVRDHRGERLLGVGDQLDMRANVLAHLRSVDVDVDEGLHLRREVGEPRGDAVVDAHADHHQDIGVLHRLQVPTGAHEAGHVQRERVVDRESADAEQRGADRRRGPLGKLAKLGFSVAEQDAVAGEHDRALRPGHRDCRGFGVLEVGVAVGLVAGNFQPPGQHIRGIGLLDVLADVDQHRPGPSGGRDVEGLVDDARQLADVGDEVAVLGD